MGIKRMTGKFLQSYCNFFHLFTIALGLCLCCSSTPYCWVPHCHFFFAFLPVANLFKGLHLLLKEASLMEVEGYSPFNCLEIHPILEILNNEIYQSIIWTCQVQNRSSWNRLYEREYVVIIVTSATSAVEFWDIWQMKTWGIHD